MARRPPSDITPAQFFETWLPETYAELGREVATPPPDTTVNVELTGAAGGQWTLTLAGGTLAVARGVTAGAPLTFVQSEADWRAITTGQAEKDLGLTLPDDSIASLDKFLIHPAMPRLVGLLASVRGALDLEITRNASRALALRLVFQGVVEPHATISLPAETLAEIQAQKTSAPEAYFAGKIQIRGDAALAMQIAMTLMTPG